MVINLSPCLLRISWNLVSVGFIFPLLKHHRPVVLEVECSLKFKQAEAKVQMAPNQSNQSPNQMAPNQMPPWSLQEVTQRWH